MFRSGQGQDPDFASWNLPSWTNPMLDKAIIERERERLPERVFNQEYGGAFVEGSGAVFRFVREAAQGELQAPQKDQFYFGGLDLARVEDFTVLVMMNRDLEVVFVDRFNRLDWAIQVARVQAAVERYNNGRLLVDSTGAGEPIYESLRAAGMWVEPYTFTARSKADLVNNLALLLEQRKILLPRPELWPEGIEELEAFEYSVTDAGNVSMSAPYGVHDDCVMALALAAWYSKAACRVPRIIRL
jgi:phage FluMu gp28-like protein